MAEKRERCRARQTQLSEKLDAKLAGSEVTGTRINELENLAAFYAAFLRIAGDTDEVLSQPWTAADESVLSSRGTELGEVCKQYAQFRLLASHALGQSHALLLGATAQAISSWKACALDDGTITSLAGAALPGGRSALVSDVMGLVKSYPAVASSLSRAGTAIHTATTLVAAAKGILSSPAMDAVNDPTNIVALQKRLAKLAADVPGDHEIHTLLPGEVEPAAELCGCLGGVIANYRELSGSVGNMAADVMGPEAAAAFHEAGKQLATISTALGSSPLRALIKELPAVRSLVACVNSASTVVESQCAGVRSTIAQLAASSTKDVIQFLTSGPATDIAVIEHYFASLVPGWRTVQMADARIVAIVSTEGELLRLDRPIPADQPFPQAFPQIVLAAGSTVESLTAVAYELAHDICLGKVRFSPAAVASFPSQIAVRFVMFLWTEMVEGSILTANRPAPRRPRTVAAADEARFRYVGAAGSGRSPRRPVSAASHASRINSPRKSISAADPRPGSASSALFKKTSGKSGGAQAASSSQSPPRPTTSDSVRRRRPASSSVRTPVPTTLVAPQRDAPPPREQSTIASKSHLSTLLSGYVRELQNYLLSEAHSSQTTTTLRVLLSWLHRCLRAWEEDVVSIPTPDDFRWIREARLYRQSGAFRLEQGSNTVPLGNHFTSMPPSFALTEAHIGVWGHVLSVSRLGMSALLAGGCDASVRSLFCLSGELINWVSASTTRLSPSARNVLFGVEGLSDVEQIAFSELLLESGPVPVVMTTSEVACVHPTLQTLPAPYVYIDANTGFQIEAELAASGCDSATALAKLLAKFAEMSQQVAKWAVPMRYLHLAASGMTPMLRQGQSSEAALYEVVTQVVLPRAPAPIVPLLHTIVDTLFTKRDSTLRFPQMTQATQRACAASGLQWSIPFDQAVIRLGLHLATPSIHTVVVRGHDSCGKSCIATACLESLKIHARKTFITVPRSVSQEQLHGALSTYDAVVVEGTFHHPLTASPRGGKLIILCNGEPNPEDLVAAGVAVMFTDLDRLQLPTLLLGSLLAVLGAKCDPATLTALFDENLMAVLAVGSSLTRQSRGRVLRTFYALLKAALFDAEGRLTPQGTVRSFWFAATWACAPGRSHDWDEFAASRMPADLRPPEGSLFGAYVDASGNWAGWETLPALEQPLQHVGTKRALFLCRRLIDQGVYVTLVSPGGVTSLTSEPAACRVLLDSEAIANSAGAASLLVVVGSNPLVDHAHVAACDDVSGALPPVGRSLVVLDPAVTPQCCSAFKHSSLAHAVARVAASPLGPTVCTYPAVSSLFSLASSIATVSPSEANALCLFSLGPLCCNDAEVELLKGAVLSSTQTAIDANLTVVSSCTTQSATTRVGTMSDARAAAGAALQYEPTDAEVRAFHGCLAHLTRRHRPQVALRVGSSTGFHRLGTLIAAVASTGGFAVYPVSSAADATKLPANVLSNPRSLLLVREEAGAGRGAPTPLAALLSNISCAVLVETTADTGSAWDRYIPVLEVRVGTDDLLSLAVHAGVEADNVDCLVAVHAAVAASVPDRAPQEVRCAMHLYGGVVAEVGGDEGRRIHQLAGFLRNCKIAEAALTRRPTTVEGDFTLPERGTLAGYSGQVQYIDYPAGPLRVAMCIIETPEGTIRECSFASVSIVTPTQHVVQLSVACGGTCRSRVESGGTQVVLTAAPIELRLERYEGGGWSGTVVDTSKGTPVVIGDVLLSPEPNAPTREWIASNPANDIPLPTHTELGLEEDVFERLLATATSNSRSLAKAADTVLRALCRKSRTSTDISTSVSLLPVLAAVPFDNRLALVDQCSDAYVQSCGRALVDVLTVETFAHAMHMRPRQLRSFLASQVDKGLPSGQFGEHVALFTRLFQTRGDDPAFVLFDPTGVLADWVANGGLRDGGRYVTSMCEHSGLFVDCSLSPASLTTMLSSTSQIDVAALSSAAHDDEAARTKIVGLADHIGGDTTALLQFLLTSEEAQGDAAVVDAIDSGAEQSAAPQAHSKKKVAAKEDPVGRVAVLVIEAYRLLPTVRQVYSRSFKEILALGVASLKAPAKGSLGPIEASTKAFGGELLAGVLQEDKLLVCTFLSMAVLFHEGRSPTPAVFADAMRALRNASPEGILEEDLQLREEAGEAYEQWASKQADAKGKKKERRDFADFLSPRAIPEYPFMTPQCWSNVLALSETVPSLANLPAALQHGDAGKGVLKQDKWADWLATCIGPLPTYEKSSEVGPLEKLLVILALRPAKMVVGLLQFVGEALGSEFPDPYALVDPAQVIASRFKQLQGANPALTLISPNLASFEAVQQLVGHAALLVATDKEYRDRPAPRVCVEHASYERTVMDVLDAVIENNDWMLIQGWEAAPTATQRRILDRIHRIPAGSFTGLILLGSRCSEEKLASAASRPLIELPVVAANFAWSLRSTMSQHYATLEGELRKLPPNVTHKLVFVASFLLSAIEQRSRFNTLGFANPTAFRRLERDAITAVSSVLALSKRKLPWDAVRQSLMITIGGLSTVPSDRAVVQAYVDWLVHPSTIGDGANEPDVSEVPLPDDPSLEAHLNAIQTLPESDSTEMIGLHSGVEQRQREAEAERIFEFVEAAFVCPSADRAAATAKELLEVIAGWNAADTPAIVAGGTVLDYVLRQEVLLQNDIVAQARADLHHAQRRRRGSVPRLGTAEWYLSESKVPAAWQEATEPIARLQEWVTYMHNRHHQLLLWAQQGIPKLILTGTLANPKAVVAGLTHDVARARGWRLETANPQLSLLQGATESSFDPSTLPPYQVCFTGLRLVGAQFDRKGAIMELFGEAVDWWVGPINDTALVTLSIGDGTTHQLPPSPVAPRPLLPSFPAPQSSPSTMHTPRTRPTSAATSRPGTAYNRTKSRVGTLDLEGASLRTALFRRPSASKFHTFHASIYTNSRRDPDSCLGEVAIPSLEDENFWMLRGAMLVAN